MSYLETYYQSSLTDIAAPGENGAEVGAMERREGPADYKELEPVRVTERDINFIAYLITLTWHDYRNTLGAKYLLHLQHLGSCL